MKVAIITILDNTNYGTYLQALATGKAIQELGHEVEIIRYTRKSMTPEGSSRQILKDRGVLRWFNRCVLKHKEREKMFELRNKDLNFLSSYLPITKEYVGFEQLVNDPPKADVYLTGSDQVWNSYYNHGIDRSFYLDFAPMNTTRISYAASIGMPEIPAYEVDDIVGLLRKYKNITVRETAAKEMLAKLGITSEVVLDPTLLLDKIAWANIANQYPFIESEPYLLTYSVEYGKENSIIKHYAKQIAKKEGLKIYHITYSGSPKDNYYDKIFNYATPDQFLNLMLHASFIVVSSFHGTAFSINFNKRFITVSPQRFNERVRSLLQITGLTDRAVTGLDCKIDKFGVIDYPTVNAKIKKERQESLNKLKNMLK